MVSQPSLVALQPLSLLDTELVETDLEPLPLTLQLDLVAVLSSTGNELQIQNLTRNRALNLSIGHTFASC